MLNNSTGTATPSPTTLPILLTVEETADALRCVPKTIYRRIQAGSLPAIKEGGRFLIDAEAVRAALISRMVKPKKITPNDAHKHDAE